MAGFIGIYDVHIPMIQAGSREDVHVTHINDPSWFFTRPAHLMQSFVQHLEGLSMTERLIKFEELELGKRVSYNSSTSGKIIRGKIVEINGVGDNITCDLLSVDYGWVDKGVAVNEIYLTAHVCQSAPFSALQCELNYCYPINGDKFDERANEVMRQYINDSVVEMTVRSIDFARSKVIVELRSKTAQDNLSTVLVHSGCSVRTPRFNHFN